MKFSRWAFEKFKGAEDKLGTQMRAVGEVMSIGKTYKEAFQKAIRSLENGRHGLGFAKDFNKRSLPDLMTMLNEPSSERQWIMYEALRKGATVEELFAKTHIKPWFIEQMKELVDLEEMILKLKGNDLPDELLVRAKKDGFADRYLSRLLGVPEARIRGQRKRIGCVEAWDALPVSGVENAAYYYSTYNRSDTVPSSSRKKVMVLGGGPNRIGQGIEFDYCCVHAAFALREAGFETIMVNCNPETVSTDYDTSDKLYFEPLTVEDVLSIYEKEKPEGVVVQFGGQTPLNIAGELAAAGVRILGTSPDTIDLAEDRDRFRRMMDKMGIPMPESGMASSFEEARQIAARIGYPVMVRPSFVLGGRGMEVVHDDEMLKQYVNAAVDLAPERPILIDRFLANAVEAEADALADGVDAFVPAVMEHIELAGIHSGDSACAIPPVTLSDRHIRTIEEYTLRISRELKVCGVMNIQYAVCQDKVYVLEANPRASRTVPLVSKVCNISMAGIATRLMLGAKLADMDLRRRTIPHVGVKEVVLPFNMFPEVDPVLGPEMRSTGEVLGMAPTFGLAYFKSQEAALSPLPLEGTVFISVTDNDKPLVLETARKFQELGFRIKATGGTCAFLRQNGVNAELSYKVHEPQRPNVVDEIKSGEIHLIINTPIGKMSATDDAYIRHAAIKYRIPYVTTTAAGHASVMGIAEHRSGRSGVKSLQNYHGDMQRQ